MKARHFTKKILRIVVYDSLSIYLLCICNFPFLFHVQRVYGQETEEITEIIENLQEEKTPVTYPPVIDKNGNIYLSSRDGKISAVDQDGNTKWHFQLADKINTGFVAGTDNTVYFSSGKLLYAIRLNSSLKWIFKTDDVIDFPAITDNQGNVYVVTKKDDFLYAIGPEGSLYWKAHINGEIASPPYISRDGNIYIATQNNMLYAINLNGTLRWRRGIFNSKTLSHVSMTEDTNDTISDDRIQPKTEPIKSDEHSSSQQPATQGHHGNDWLSLKSDDQTALQQPLISYAKPEEIQASPQETDKPAITSFSASPQKGVYPLKIKFSDASTGKIINKFWDFGDGTLISTEEHPIHTYNAPGSYDVRLVIRRPDSIVTIIKRDYITVTNDRSYNSNEIKTHIQ